MHALLIKLKIPEIPSKMNSGEVTKFPSLRYYVTCMECINNFVGVVFFTESWKNAIPIFLLSRN